MEATNVDARITSLLNSENSEILFDRDLPDELLVKIFSYLTEPKDLKSIWLTSHKFSEVSSEQLKTLPKGTEREVIARIKLINPNVKVLPDLQDAEMEESPEKEAT